MKHIWDIYRVGLLRLGLLLAFLGGIIGLFVGAYWLGNALFGEAGGWGACGVLLILLIAPAAAAN